MSRGGSRPGAGRPLEPPFRHARQALERALGFIDRLPADRIAELVVIDPVWRGAAERLGVGNGRRPATTDRQDAAFNAKEFENGNQQG